MLKEKVNLNKIYLICLSIIIIFVIHNLNMYLYELLAFFMHSLPNKLSAFFTPIEQHIINNNIKLFANLDSIDKIR